MLFKTNLHFHTHKDEEITCYDIYKYIDYAKERGFNVLAYTPHRRFLFKEEYSRYAKDRDILLIPGIEMEIDQRHILVLNCDNEVETIKTFEELRNYKNKNPQIFIIAPHPFIASRKSLKKKFLENVDLFDVVEMSVFSNWLFNFNKRAGKEAQRHNKPFIATSDTHFLKDIERGYALINIETSTQSVGVEAVLSAIKTKHFHNKLNPMGPLAMIKHTLKAIFNHFFGNVF